MEFLGKLITFIVLIFIIGTSLLFFMVYTDNEEKEEEEEEEEEEEDEQLSMLKHIRHSDAMEAIPLGE